MLVKLMIQKLISPLKQRRFKILSGGTYCQSKVLERELKSLEKTGDHYPKVLLTLDKDLETDYDGITKLNVVDWLLKEK